MSAAKTVARESRGLYKEKGSEFLAFLYPVTDRAEADAILKKLRKEYHDARHVCYAWRIGQESKENDDGEPAHTAGAPIMRALRATDLENVLLAVARYFGGTKLGVPGLIHAYGRAAQDAVAKAEIIPLIYFSRVSVVFDYEMSARLYSLFDRCEARVLSQEFGARCNFAVELPETQLEIFRQNLLSLYPSVEFSFL